MFRCSLMGLVLAFGSIAAGQDAARDPATAEAPRQMVEAQALRFEVVFAKWLKLKDAEKGEGISLDKINVDALEKSGRLAVLQRVKLSALSQQTATVQLGERRARIASVSSGRGGFGPQSQVSLDSFGTLISLTARVDGEKIVAEVNFERSAPDEGEAGPVIGEDPAGQKLKAEGSTTTLIKTAVTLKDGETVLVGGAAGPGDQEGLVLLLTAAIAK